MLHSPSFSSRRRERAGLKNLFNFEREVGGRRGEGGREEEGRVGGGRERGSK